MALPRRCSTIAPCCSPGWPTTRASTAACGFCTSPPNYSCCPCRWPWTPLQGKTPVGDSVSRPRAPWRAAPRRHGDGVGLIVIYTTSAPVAQAFVEAAPSSPEQAGVLLLGDLFANVGKELRVFSELLLGAWLGGTGALLLLRARSRAVRGWVLGVARCWWRSSRFSTHVTPRRLPGIALGGLLRRHRNPAASKRRSRRRE